VPAHPYDYAVIRVVPRVEREEFINVGVIVSCPALNFLQARIELDADRIRFLDATIDMEAVRLHLETIPKICAGGEDAGPIGKLPQRNRFQWLSAPRSTIIQTSAVHTGRADNPNAILEHLFRTMVKRSTE
jgi:hypothetical protein